MPLDYFFYKKIRIKYFPLSENKDISLIENSFYNFCRDCYDTFVDKEGKIIEKLMLAGTSNKEVEIVSKNYKGIKPVHGEKYHISTREYEDRDDAIDEMKVIARVLDCDIIVNMEFDKSTDWEDTDSGGTHYYTVWSCSGIATHKA